MGAVKPRRNYTEKDLIDKIDKLEGEIHDLKDMVRTLADMVTESKPPKKKEYVYGIKGIADLLGVSESTVERWKKDGVLTGEYIQRNRSIIAEKEKVLQIFDDPCSRWGIRKYTRLK